MTLKSTTTFVEMNTRLNPILGGSLSFVTLNQPLSISVFTPQPLRAVGYCFHPWCPDGRAGAWQEKVCPAYISKSVRCRKLILGYWLGGVGVQHHDVTLI